MVWRIASGVGPERVADLGQLLDSQAWRSGSQRDDTEGQVVGRLAFTLKGDSGRGWGMPSTVMSTSSL